jgi:hypothetical protein
LVSKFSIRNIILVVVLSLLAVQLNFYFAWTSHVGTTGFGPGTFGTGTLGNGSYGNRTGIERYGNRTGIFVNGRYGNGTGTFGTGRYGNGTGRYETNVYGNGGSLRSFLVSEVNGVTGIQLAIPGVSSFFKNLGYTTRISPFGSAFNYTGGLNFSQSNNTRLQSFGAAYGGTNMQEQKYFIDFEVVLFTLAIFAISLLLFVRKGIGTSILRAFEITSAAILPLGLEIYLFDYGQFNIHASDIQVLVGFAWFTNADVLVVTTGILVAAFFIEIVRWTKRGPIAKNRLNLP